MTHPLAVVISLYNQQMGRGDARRCDKCSRHYIPRSGRHMICRLCGREDEGVRLQVRSDGTAWHLLQSGKWRPHPYTAAYLGRRGYEIARCGGCNRMRYKPVGANCERCGNTCGELFQ